MARLSLASRLALLFAACTALVSLIAGVLFSQAATHHFVELDRLQIQGKLELFANLVSDVTTPESLESKRTLIEQELQRHPELALLVESKDGQLRFSSKPEIAKLPMSIKLIRKWSSGQTEYRVMETYQGNLRISLLLDIGHHQHFLTQVQHLIWWTMGLAALATALLGLWAARRSLAPLARLTRLSQTVSARSLDQRLDSHALPAELAPLGEAFNAMLGRLQDAFERLSGFSADIAHELRTPLSNLLTQTQVTLSQPRSAEYYCEALHDNLEELQQLAQMVNDMLFLAKAEHGLLSPQAQSLALHEEIGALLEFFAPLAEEHQVRLSQQGQARLQGDRGMWRRALSNLLDNALRFTPAGGEIRVTLQEQAQEVLLEIANQGPAIAAEQQQRLFDRFYRADPARREGRGEHAGLGLAITRSIVRAHGGDISVACAAGWTRFSIRLPVPH